MSELSPSVSEAELLARLSSLGARMAQGGEGATIFVHAQDSTPGAETVADAAPRARIIEHNSYDGLPDLLAKTRPDACLSYRFGPGYPRAPLVDGPDRPAYVHVAGTGFDHLLPFAPERVMVGNSAGFQAGVMADYALAAVLAINIDLRVFAAQQAKRQWAGRSLCGAHGQRAVVFGIGPIGAAIATLLSAAGLSVTGISRSGRSDPAFREVVAASDLASVVPTVDHLVVAIPLTDETRGLVSAEVLGALPRGAGVVNLARGGIVDEAALLACLQSGELRGAVFDVFETEPLLVDTRLWDAPGMLITPHTSALFDGWEAAAAEVFRDNLRRIGSGAQIANRIDPFRGY
ncbi:MAG: D-2-hydroxyacid dehydrogenase [Pseudomonadota bacterium]